MTDKPQDTAPEAIEQKPGFAGFARAFLPLWPFVLGLTFGRSGIIIASFGSYTQTDDGIYTDGSMLITVALFGLAVLFMFATKARLSKQQAKWALLTGVAFEALALVGLAFLEITGSNDTGIRFALCTCATLFGSVALSYWLRRARGTTTAIAAAFTFSALFLSEIIIYACALIPPSAGFLLGLFFVLLQYPCLRAARSRSKLFLASSTMNAQDYFGFAKSMLSSRNFLVATACGVAVMSIAIGMLRGYPTGDPITFTNVTRIAYMVITMSIAATIVILVAKGRRQIMTVGIWLIMQTLACFALLCYTAFPGSLDIGAVFTTTLNAMMTAFSWYLVIAFMSYGWRDPFFYAFSGWIVWLGARAIARIAIIEAYPLAANDMFMTVAIAVMLILSTQVVFVQFIYIAKSERDQEKTKTSKRQSTIERLMGLDASGGLSGMRQATMRHNAEEMGKQFLLSDREVEVLSLYALGFTQK
ncbi:MAG: LuxR family transcriptional regulator, partial [Raoultibacter sp.]